MSETVPASDPNRVRETLARHGQSHLLSFYEHLSPDRQTALLEHLSAIDWDYLDELIVSHVNNKPDLSAPQPIEPAPYYPFRPTGELADTYAEARREGEKLIRAGKVAAFTVAGGQGTRLGWEAPKGTFPATPLSGKPLFQLFAEQLLKTQKTYGATVPWYVMTSLMNHQDTRGFFEAHDYFGLARENVMLFPQGTMPSIGFDGKLLLAEEHALALNPNGHGGSLTALARSGALDDMARRGITQISYFQVDNPNVRCVDPLFIGLHALNGAEMSSKMLRKVSPTEKVGNFCKAAGRLQVIEYSDMPDELAHARGENGELTFDAGSIAIHVIAVDFARRLTEGKGDRLALPFHRAEKAVPYLDPETGEKVVPERPNAVKLERFIFDALPLAERSILLETDRTQEFAPIKNADGSDSPETSKKLQVARAARWLEGCGVSVPYDDAGEVAATVEISPLTALEPSDLERLDLPEKLERGEKLIL